DLAQDVRRLRPRGERRQGHVAVDEREDVAALLVRTEVTLGPVETHRLEVLDDAPHQGRSGRLRAAHRVADPHHRTRVSHTAREGSLFIVQSHSVIFAGARPGSPGAGTSARSVRDGSMEYPPGV